MFWDFISLMPMTTHQVRNIGLNSDSLISLKVSKVSFLFSDRGTPIGYRFMNGYVKRILVIPPPNTSIIYVPATVLTPSKW